MEPFTQVVAITVSAVGDAAGIISEAAGQVLLAFFLALGHATAPLWVTPRALAEEVAHWMFGQFILQGLDLGFVAMFALIVAAAFVLGLVGLLLLVIAIV